MPDNALTLTVVEGSFAADREHILRTDVFESARHSLESAALYFSENAIADATVRVKYVDGIRRMSRMVLEEVSAGRMSAAEGAAFCHNMRNRIMEATRKVTSPQGLAFAQAKKADGRRLGALLDRYANRMFSKSFGALTEAQKDQAYYAVIDAAGRNNAKVTARTARLRVAGKVGILLTGALAGHAIVSAEDKATEAARQVTILEGGLVGGALAGMSVSALCGPGAPICAIAVLIVGSTTGALLTEKAYDVYLDEVREFREWGIR